MFEKCLIGSLIFHIFLWFGVGLSLPQTVYNTTTPVYFEVVAAGKVNSKDLSSSSSLNRETTKPLLSQPKISAKHIPISSFEHFNHEEQIVSNQIRTTPVLPNENIKQNPGNGSSLPVTNNIIFDPDSSKTDSINNGNDSDNQSVTEDDTVLGKQKIADQPPRKLIYPAPPYPEVARRKSWQGTVILEYVVKTDGTVGDVRVVQSSGYRILDNAALTTVKEKWRYQPAIKNGSPVDYILRYTFPFKLEGVN